MNNNEAERSTLSGLIRILGNLLGEVIIEQDGVAAFELEEQVRQLAKQRRAEASMHTDNELAALLGDLTIAQLTGLIKAFTHYFGLVNLAEGVERLRILHLRDREKGDQPRLESIEQALIELKDRGITAEQIQAMLDQAQILAVFTAHPTEAKRRTTLKKLHRIASAAQQLIEGEPLPHQHEQMLQQIAEEVVTLWQSDEVRIIKPTVIDEVKNGLYYFEESLVTMIPQLYRDMEAAFARVYPEHAWHIPAFVRFGSWIGGDRDGNPFVTPSVTVETLRLLMTRMVRQHIAAIEDLSHRLSQSSRQVAITRELQESLTANAELFPDLAQVLERRNPHEPYRQKCSYIHRKLYETLKYIEQFQANWAIPTAQSDQRRYTTANEVLHDLELIEHSLRANGGSTIADGFLRDVWRSVGVFGLNTATLDIRQHSSRHTSALHEIFAHAGVCSNFNELDHEQRTALLEQELANMRPLIPAHLHYSDETNETIEVFRVIATVLNDLNADVIQTYVISMSESPADILAVLLLAREAGLYVPQQFSKLNIAPLFETGADLAAAANIRPLA